MRGTIVRISLEEIDSPGNQLCFKVADFGDDITKVLDQREELVYGPVKTEIYSARYVRYPGKPEKTFFVKTDDSGVFNALVDITEGDRVAIKNEGFRDGYKTGCTMGESAAIATYKALPLWKRILRKWD